MLEEFASKHGGTGYRIFEFGIKIGTCIRKEVGEEQNQKA